MPRLVTEAQRTPEWFAAKLGHMSASTAGAALGFNPYKSMRSAWREIVGCKTDAEKRVGEPGTPAHFGVVFEAPARLAYEAHTGAWVTETGLWESDEHPWLQCSPDGTVDDDGLLECKTPEYAKQRCPAHYRIQCLVQLIVMKRKWVDYWSWGWRDQVPYLERIFPLSATGEAALLKRLKAWHERHILGGEEPGRKKPRRKRASNATLMPF